MVIILRAETFQINWVSIVYGSQLTYRTTCLWSLGFVFLFTVGGLTGVVLTNSSIDIVLALLYSKLFCTILHLSRCWNFRFAKRQHSFVLRCFRFWFTKWFHNDFRFYQKYISFINGKCDIWNCMHKTGSSRLSRGQPIWLLTMRSRVWFVAFP